MSKMLFTVLGFVLGVAGTLFVDVARAWRHRTVLFRLMLTEGEAFRKTCQRAGEINLLTSSDARRVAELIQQGFTQDRERWSVWESERGPGTVVSFFLECAGLLDLIKLQEQHSCSGTQVGSPMDRDTYKIIVARTEEFLKVARNEIQLRCRIHW